MKKFWRIIKELFLNMLYSDPEHDTIVETKEEIQIRGALLNDKR